MSLTLSEIEKLHQAGDLQTAKENYLLFLKDHPQEVRPLHLLGILYAEEGNLDEAEKYLERAIALNDADPTLKLHLANILKAKKAYPKAEAVLFELTKTYPQFASAFNNLGTVYFAEEKWQEAVKAYETAINIQANYIDAYYNLGLALIRLNRIEEASNAFHAILEMSESHPAAQFQLGRLLMQQGQFQKAYERFLKLQKNHPHHAETHTNLATSALRLGRLDEAKAHYLKTIEITPRDTQALFNLGVIAAQLGKLDEALNYYFLAIKYQSDFFDAHYNIGYIFLVKGDKANAILHFQKASSLKPQDESLKHTLAILKQQKNIAGSPPDYVRALFDSYADHFEPHLKQFLHYQVPQVLYAAIKKEQGDVTPSWDILDIGCGTGLTGELFKPWAKSLIGVDLSSKMLDVAEQKKIYDKLIEGDILDFLADKKAAFDLVVAGDVLVYYGELDALFAEISKALRSQGRFLFNTEIHPTDNYQLTSSGRFSHGKTYLDQLAQKNGFKIVTYETTTMRTQNNEPVLGHLYLLSKTF